MTPSYSLATAPQNENELAVSKASAARNLGDSLFLLLRSGPRCPIILTWQESTVIRSNNELEPTKLQVGLVTRVNAALNCKLKLLQTSALVLQVISQMIASQNPELTGGLIMPATQTTAARLCQSYVWTHSSERIRSGAPATDHPRSVFSTSCIAYGNGRFRPVISSHANAWHESLTAYSTGRFRLTHPPGRIRPVQSKFACGSSGHRKPTDNFSSHTDLAFSKRKFDRTQAAQDPG